LTASLWTLCYVAQVAPIWARLLAPFPTLFSTVILNACHFTGWDAGKKGEPCIRADGGRVAVSGCEFMDAGKKAIVLEKGLKAATITGCLLRGEEPVVNESAGDVQVGMNTTQ
jgi:hypothetical protein